MNFTVILLGHFVFIWSAPSKPPMIIFDRNFKPNLGKLIAANPWNPMCDLSLTKLVENLFQLFAKHQIDLCMAYDRLSFDLKSFDNQFDGMEAILLPKAGSINNIDANFTFKIHVDKVHCLPSPFVTDTDVDDCALLVVKFKSNFDRANVELRLPDFINRLLLLAIVSNLDVVSSRNVIKIWVDTELYFVRLDDKLLTELTNVDVKLDKPNIRRPFGDERHTNWRRFVRKCLLDKQ
uniref:BRISC and BRCA1-A complex member 2 n=1 Tax=Romanomermis culicivorax TaxID=13658 RepID=A0A915L2F7_ROMCU